jgi:hypothetical protein
VERDLATLAREFPLEEEADGKQKKRYRLRASNVPAASIGPMEFLAFDGACKVLAPTKGGPFRKDLAIVRQKVRALVAGQKAMNGAQLFLPHPRGYVDYTGHEEMLDEIVDAICQHRVLDIHYRKAGRSGYTYSIRPPRCSFMRVRCIFRLSSTRPAFPSGDSVFTASRRVRSG